MFSAPKKKDKAVTQKPDKILIKEIITGNTDSFTELCRRYYPAMVAIAHSVLGDRHLAEDAAQETFAKAAVKLGQLKNKDRIAFWLATICRNTAKDIARTRKPFCSTDKLLDISTEESKGNKNSQDSPASQAVTEAMGKLSASAREVIFLRFYDGLSYEQISAVLGISAQAINGRLRRAKKKLARHLQRKGFGKVQL